MKSIVIGNTHIGMGGNPSNKVVNSTLKFLDEYGMLDTGGEGHGSAKYKMQVTLPNGEIGYVDIKHSSSSGAHMRSIQKDKGHWIFHTYREVMSGNWLILNDWIGDGYECSECGIILEEKLLKPVFRYCPYCGKEMDTKNIK